MHFDQGSCHKSWSGYRGQFGSADLQTWIGWRLPKEVQPSKLLQILPISWLPRISNRQQFLEVIILDTWFRRTGQRKVIFRQTAQDIEATFLPSGDPTGTEKRPTQNAAYSEPAVY